MAQHDQQTPEVVAEVKPLLERIVIILDEAGDFDAWEIWDDIGMNRNEFDGSWVSDFVKGMKIRLTEWRSRI